MKVVLAGATGFIGRSVLQAFEDHEIILLSRRKTDIPGVTVVEWDAKTLGAWAEHLDGADALINLSGAPVTLPWTPANRELIRSSRVDSSSVLGKAAVACAQPPKAWVNGSAVGFYGNRRDEELKEGAAVGSGFLAETCAEWEHAAASTCPIRTRLVLLRTGVVLGRGGGAFEPLKKLTQLFLGGTAGSGEQWVSWIHMWDMVGLVGWCLQNRVNGPVNAVAPAPVTNHAMMEEFRKKLGRPWSPPVPTLGLNIVSKLGGPDPSTLLDSCRALPEVAIQGGFRFKFPTLDVALDDLVRR